MTALPDGWHTITPRIVVDDVAGLFVFLQRVFGATGDCVDDRPTILKIGDSNIMLSTTGPRESMPAFLYVYVEDVDVTHALAVEAGGKSLEPPWDTPYGDRRCLIEDPYENLWQVATYQPPT
ncbi:MAG TPA: VOC family protein [Pyrinomonadaceae bacterium]|nr:VOC family protein [Pyrinomonadaceae bacterium]